MALLAIAAACGGGGGGGGSVTPGSSGGIGAGTIPTNAPVTGATAGPMQTMALTISIPGKKSSARARGPQYIAPNSGSLTMTLLTVNGVAVTGTTAQGPYNLTAGPTNPACTANQNGTTCTFSISAPTGTDLFLANTYSSANGTGQALGSGSIILSVRQNATNSANLSLTGPVNSVQIVTASPSLNNGNPPPFNSDSNSGNSVQRKVSPADKKRFGTLRAQRRAASLRGKVSAQSTTTARISVSSTRRAPAASSATPSPAATSSRVFVIALDAAGNQIINPTTFDIPIHLTLNLNGAPAGSVTLAVTYAGLTGEPTSPATTQADGGVVDVLAPSDQITLTTGTVTSTSVTPFAPSIIANYTPQGGALQASVPLVYSVFVAPPAPFFVASITHVDPMTLNVPATLTMSVTNAGTGNTSGQIEADVYTFNGEWSYNNNTGSDPSWNCTNYGSEIDCLTNAVIAPGASLPLIFNITPAQSGQILADIDPYGGGATNSPDFFDEIFAQDTINVNNTPTPALGINVTNSGTYYATVPDNFQVNVWNPGSADTTSATTMVMTLPSSPANFAYTGFTGAGWNCVGPTPTITCTFAGAIAANGNSGTNNVPVTINVTPPQPDVDATPAWSGTVSGGGASQPATSSGSTFVSSPIQFTGAGGLNLGTQFGNVFAPGDGATLSIGAPLPSPQPVSVFITTQSAASGTYSIVGDSCTGPVIDGVFMGGFPVAAGAVGSPISVGLNVNSSVGNLGPCFVTIQDSVNNTATLNIGVGQTNITVQGHRRPRSTR